MVKVRGLEPHQQAVSVAMERPGRRNASWCDLTGPTILKQGGSGGKQRNEKINLSDEQCLGRKANKSADARPQTKRFHIAKCDGNGEQ